MVTTDRGDVVELLDAAGNPFVAYHYDAWGNPQDRYQAPGNVATGIYSQTTTLITNSQVATDIANRQVLRYARYCYDSESGLYYLSARSYDPTTRQFLSKDLARADGEESAYEYCTGNPVGHVDPSGLWCSGWVDPAHSYNSKYGGQESKWGFTYTYHNGVHINCWQIGLTIDWVWNMSQQKIKYIHVAHPQKILAGGIGWSYGGIVDSDTQGGVGDTYAYYYYQAEYDFLGGTAYAITHKYPALWFTCDYTGSIIGYDSN